MTVYLSRGEQKIMDKALRRSTRLIASGDEMKFPPNVWRAIPIDFWIMEYPIMIPPVRPGTINYAIPEPCREYLLAEEIYAILQRSLLLGHPPAGVIRGLIRSVKFQRSVDRALRDVVYPHGINPIANVPDFGPTLFGQMFITRSGEIARMVTGENQIHPEFIALTE